MLENIERVDRKKGNRRIRKEFAFIAAVLVCAGLFSGCGRRDDTVNRRSSRRRGEESTERSERTSRGVSSTEREQSEVSPPTRAMSTRQEATEPSGQPRIYADNKEPNYIATNPRWETMYFTWECQDDLGTLEIEVPVDAEMYAYYRKLPRYWGVENLYKYVNDANNQQIIKDIVEIIQTYIDQYAYDDDAVAREAARFVQAAIEYEYDSVSTGMQEYPRYPIETLYEHQGDCEDTSILMAALLKQLGYEVGFFHVPGHVAVAIRTADTYAGGAYYEINGHRYLFIESTSSGWKIGEIPQEYMETGAELYLIP